MDLATLLEPECDPLQAARAIPFTTYRSPLERGSPNNAAQSNPEKSSTRSAAPSAVEVPSTSDVDIEDNDGPMPKANVHTTQRLPSPSTVSSVSSYALSPHAPRISSPLSKRSSGSSFNSLYDVSSSSDDEHIDAFFLQLKASDSVKSAAARRKNSAKLELIIPEADRWPTIQNFRKAVESGELSPSPRLPLSPAALARLANAVLQTPATGNAPSLIDSTTDDRSASCPSTPDPPQSPLEEDDWHMPLQLNPLALDTLHNISADLVYDTGQSPQAVATLAHEMQDRGLNLSVVVSPAPNDIETPISDLSVPSPGGFFASLNEAARQSWHPSAMPDIPSSAVAETFYLGPANTVEQAHGKPPDHAAKGVRLPVSEQVLEIKDDAESEGPPTARQEDYVRKDSIDISEVDEISVKENIFEYDEDYATKLLDTANANMNRTSMWLSAQASYISGIASPESPRYKKHVPKLRTMLSKDPDPVPTDSPDPNTSPESKATSSSRTRVRFSKHLIGSRVATRSPTSPKNDSLFYHAFQHLYDGGGERDAIVYAQTRSEALELQRQYLPHGHLSQIVGDREIKIEPPSQSTPPSGLPERPDDAIASARKAAVALANIERQALEQIKLSVWNLEAMRQLNGGSLIDKSAVSLMNHRIRKGEEVLVLDLGGEPTADWGWAVAIEHRNASVYTAVPSSPISPTKWQAHRGPSNHRTVAMQNPWTLPFASETFDVVSARTLHTLLRTNRKLCTPPLKQQPFAHDFPTPSPRKVPPLDTGQGQRNYRPLDGIDPYAPDELALTLAELRRVLKPAGILSFSLMDAELFYPSPFSTQLHTHASSPTSRLAALSINFAEALKRRRYDPQPTAHFLPSLKQAGFSGIRRAWTVLPLSHVSFGAPGAQAGDIGRAIGSESDEERDAAVTGRTDEVAGLTGLVGGLAWERWMVGLAAEMGREGEKVVARCGRVFAEYRRVGLHEQGKGAGWRCLRGWCRKEDLKAA